MWRLADQQLDEFVAAGRCEFIGAYSQPFAMLVVADLLGVPEDGSPAVPRGLRPPRRHSGELGVGGGRAGRSTPCTGSTTASPRYIEDRRREPRAATCSPTSRWRSTPTASTPDVTAVVRTATFLFAAGQETTARLLATALKYLAEYPELQDELRGASRADPRLRRGGAAHREPGQGRLPARPAGDRPLAASTSPRERRSCCSTAPPTATRERFECPAEFRVDRPNAREHIAFGRGVHSCPGGPLARAEGRISFERILDRMRDIRLSEEHHGPRRRAPLRLRADVGPPRPHRPHLEFADAGCLTHSRPRSRPSRVGSRPPGKGEQVGAFHLGWWSEQMLDWAFAHPEFKTQLFRFVDVFPSCRDDADVLRHLDEYFDGVPVPRAVDLGLDVAEHVPLGATVVAAVVAAQHPAHGAPVHRRRRRRHARWSALAPAVGARRGGHRRPAR